MANTSSKQLKPPTTLINAMLLSFVLGISRLCTVRCNIIKCTAVHAEKSCSRNMNRQLKPPTTLINALLFHCIKLLGLQYHQLHCSAKTLYSRNMIRHKQTPQHFSHYCTAVHPVLHCNTHYNLQAHLNLSEH